MPGPAAVTQGAAIRHAVERAPVFALRPSTAIVRTIAVP